MEKELDDIVKKTYELYTKYGIKSISMDDISRNIGISKKTLYTHIKDKEDLVRKVAFYDIKQKKKQFASLKNSNLNAIEELLEVDKFMYKILKNYNHSFDFDLKKYYPTLSNEVCEEKFKGKYEEITNNIEKGKKEGLYRKNIDTDIIAKLHLLRIDTNIELDLYIDYKDNSYKVFKEIITYHLYGICNKNGIKFLEENIKSEF